MPRPRVNENSSPQVLERALAVLGLFDEARPEWSEARIARMAALPSTTTNRIVRALEHHGLLLRTTAGTYRLGPAAVALGRRAAASFDLASAVRPELERLAGVTGETAVLVVPDASGIGARCVDRVETHERLRLSLDVGAVVPLHAGATSKALLAFLGPEDVEQVLAAPLPRLAPGTITDADALRADLAVIRSAGYATSREETNTGAWGVAAPVLDRGEAVAAVSVVGPLARHTRAVEEHCREEVRTSAMRLRAALPR